MPYPCYQTWIICSGHSCTSKPLNSIWKGNEEILYTACDLTNQNDGPIGGFYVFIIASIIECIRTIYYVNHMGSAWVNWVSDDS
jgi:hypothetical protein